MKKHRKERLWGKTYDRSSPLSPLQQKLTLLLIVLTSFHHKTITKQYKAMSEVDKTEKATVSEKDLEKTTEKKPEVVTKTPWSKVRNMPFMSNKILNL